jgi:hypothetical protein
VDFPALVRKEEMKNVKIPIDASAGEKCAPKG